MRYLHKTWCRRLVNNAECNCCPDLANHATADRCDTCSWKRWKPDDE